MKFISLFTLIILSFTFSESLHAASVSKVKGRKVLITAKGSELEVGKVFHLVSEQGKVRGLVKISKVKGTKAIGVLSKKSRAKVGWKLKKRVRKISKKRRRKRKDDEYDPRAKLKSIAIGAMFGANMTTMLIENFGTASTQYKDITLSGMGYNAKAMVDYRLFDSLWFRGLVGYEALVTADAESEADTCGKDVFNLPCLVEINYATLDLQARYVFGIGTFRPWLGGGINVLLPIEQATTVLDEDKIQVANTFVGALGVDLHFTPSIMLPIQAEFNFFPSSDTVTAYFIAVRAGLAIKF